MLLPSQVHSRYSLLVDLCLLLSHHCRYRCKRSKVDRREVLIFVSPSPSRELSHREPDVVVETHLEGIVHVLTMYQEDMLGPRR